MSSKSMAKAVDLLERWYVLLEKENTGYQTENYITSPSQKTTDSNDDTIDTDTKILYRSKLFEWMYQLVDKYSLDRELVAIAGSYMDRYIPLSQHQHPSINRGYTYQLVGMTSLHLAIKITRDQGKCAGATSFARLSRGLFTEDDINTMEWSMLTTLQWRMHPPTAVTFATLLLMFVPRDACSPFSRHDLFERIRYLLEISVTIPFFLGKKTSNMAVGAFIVIMESEEQPNVSETEHRAQFKRYLFTVAGIDSDADKVIECRDAMKKIQQEAAVELKKKVAVQTSPAVTP